MSEYIAAFRTHFAAMASCKRLAAAGVRACMEPVPRAISSSCGVCVRYSAEGPMAELMHRDLEGIYERREGDYLPVLKTE